MAQVQNYRNHVRFFPPYHFFVLPVLLVNVFVVGRHAWSAPSFDTVFGLVVALALSMTALTARLMALTVQDRVIRLEMGIRLRQVLPADLHGRIKDLTRKQLLALRFGSDADLVALVPEVLAGRLTEQKAIKLKITDWQGDYLRA
jgi:hypothetical protein